MTNEITHTYYFTIHCTSYKQHYHTFVCIKLISSSYVLSNCCCVSICSIDSTKCAYLFSFIDQITDWVEMSRCGTLSSSDWVSQCSRIQMDFSNNNTIHTCVHEYKIHSNLTRQDLITPCKGLEYWVGHLTQ